MQCHFSSLKNKEVINVCDGAALGCICDLEVNLVTGQVVRLLLPGEGISGMFSAKKRISIPWSCVERIGDDVILVRFSELPSGDRHPDCKPDCCDSCGPKGCRK